MKIIAIIPARYASSRFEGKPLADLHGKPMIWWVYNQVKKVKQIEKVIVAIDDKRIEKICLEYGLEYIFTSDTHNSSTERLFEVSQTVKSDYYICINGDEPLIQPEIIEKIIPTVLRKGVFVSNLMVKIKTGPEVLDNTNIKVVFNDQNEAIFMSRSPIPYPKGSLDYTYFKHIGVLCYTVGALQFFANTKKGLLEKIEDINELRFLENKQSVFMIPVETNILSVDTPKDLEYVKNYMTKNNII